jgi:hypothetical protein
MGIKLLKMLQDFPSRWIGDYNMLRRLTCLQESKAL